MYARPDRGLLEGKEISSPFGRAVVRKWREADGIVVSDLLWGGRLYARPNFYSFF